MIQFTVTKLPTDRPFLLLEWKRSRNHRYDWTCFYNIYIPVSEHDIRAKKVSGGYFCRSQISKTFVGGESDRVDDGIVDTPFRDGAHIKWDSVSLRLPAYVRYGDMVQRIVFDENKKE